MDISFDPAKRERTLLNRGLDFMDAPEVFAAPNYRFIDDRFEYGEEREVVIGSCVDEWLSSCGLGVARSDTSSR